MRALDEDTKRFLLLLFFFSIGPDRCFWEFHPSFVTLGIFVFFLIFCESLVCTAHDGMLYMHVQLGLVVESTHIGALITHC